jgi:hypothetical protein
VGYTLRSSGLIRREASWDRISQSALKTGEGVTASGARGVIVEIMWSES